MIVLSSLRQRPRLFNWIHLIGLAQAESQTHPEERAVLCRHAACALSAVEVGTFMGLTAGCLALALPSGGVLYCVDPYPGGGESIQAVAHRHLKRLGVWERVRMLRSDARGAMASLPAQVDFFFVDGDHSYEGLSTDWQVVRQLLRPGGIAAFHDTARDPDATQHSEGAIKFFEEVILQDQEFESVERVRSLNVIRRKA